MNAHTNIPAIEAADAEAYGAFAASLEQGKAAFAAALAAEEACFAEADRKDERDRRRALKVKNLTPEVLSAIEAAIVAYDAADALYAIFRTLDAEHTLDRAGQEAALRRRRDRAEARWSKARDAAQKLAEAVLDVPTPPGLETAVKFEAFSLLTYVANTNPRHRKPFSVDRFVGRLFDEDAKHILVKALEHIGRDRSVGARHVVGHSMAALVGAYKAALDAEAGADGSPEYEARFGASMAAESALLAAEPRTLAELNAKAKAFTNPDGSVDDVGDSAQAARVIQALARDIDRLASVMRPMTRSAVTASDRSAWDGAMAEFERAFAEYAALDAAEDARRDALYRDVFGQNLERFTERVWTQTPGRARLWFRYPDTDALQAALPTMSAEDRLALAAAIQELGPGLRAIEADSDPRHQEELSDRWFEALEALDAIPAPDLPALALKMRQELALEAGIYPWQIDTEDEMVKQLTLKRGAERLRFTWYQDVLRLAGADSPIVDAKAWDVEAWTTAFYEAGGQIILVAHPDDPNTPYRATFSYDPSSPKAENCCALVKTVEGWRNKVLAQHILERRRALKRATVAAIQASGLDYVDDPQRGAVPIIGYVGEGDEVHFHEGGRAHRMAAE